MFDVIDLLSDPIDTAPTNNWPSQNTEIIELSDEEDEPQTQYAITKTLEERTSFSGQAFHDTTVKYTSVPGHSENILDLENWLSSDEESLNVSALYTPQKPISANISSMNPQVLAKHGLLSSPVLGAIKESQFESEIPGIPLPGVDVSKPSITGDRDSNDLKRTASKRLIPNVSSDPIECSSQTKVSPDKITASKLKAKKKDVGERGSKAWKDANKVTRRKDEILSEMVIEIALCLQTKIETDYFKSIFTLPTVRSSYLEIPLISWKRRVSAKYNKDEDIFVPCELTEVSERVLLLFYEPEDLVTKLKKGLVSKDIERAKAKGASEDPMKDHFACIMVPRFGEYIRKLQTKENREYRAKTLLQLHQTQQTVSTREKTLISASEALRLLVESEVKLGVNIFTTKTMEETIDWLHSFTYTIGSSLYDKFERYPEFANIGGSRLGSDSKSTFIEMVKKFNLMTDPKAENLYQYYASPLSIYTRLLAHDDLGTVQGRSIVPPSVNKIMKRVFTSQNPNAVVTD